MAMTNPTTSDNVAHFPILWRTIGDWRDWGSQLGGISSAIESPKAPRATKTSTAVVAQPQNVPASGDANQERNRIQEQIDADLVAVLAFVAAFFAIIGIIVFSIVIKR
jgi:hypothetical protein